MDKNRTGSATNLFGEHETAQQRSALFRRQRIEDTIENQLGQQQFIACTDLTCNATLHIDDIGGSGEIESPKDAFAAFELLKLKYVVCGLNSLLEVSDFVLMSALLGVEGVKMGKLG
jgi:hypothetical protein